LIKATNKVAQPLFTRLGKGLTEKVGGDAIQCELEKMGWRQVVADERSNSLYICAAKPEMSALKEIIAKLDFALPQYLVEAVVIEFSINESKAKHHIEVQPRPGLTALSDLGLVVTTKLPFESTDELGLPVNENSYMATLRGELDRIVNALATNPAVR